MPSYLWRAPQGYQAGVFLEVYNLTNHVNYGPPSGRTSSIFLVPIVADEPLHCADRVPFYVLEPGS